MSVSRPRFPALFHIVLILLVAVPVTQPALSARAGAQSEQAEDRRRNGVPDPCELARTPPGEANGLHWRCEAAGAGAGVARGDFNGDNVADLAIGVPYEDLDGINAAGVVHVIYGTATGLTSTGDQLFDARTFGFPLGSDDHFGWALAAGDFDGDGFSDLAIGMPDYESSGSTNDGIVFAMDGSASGLAPRTPGTVGTLNGTAGRVGAALVWADFNGDGYGDLAVGIPNATVHGEGFACSKLAFNVSNAGEVQVLYGSASGLAEFGAQVFHQGGCDFGEDGEGVGDSIEDGDRFGSTLSAMRSGTGADDLVIGVPNEDLGLFDKIDAGVVHVVPGLSSGLERFYAQTLSQDTPGVGGGAESNDQFGRVLATGNFNGSGGQDLAVGVPFEDLSSNTLADAGAVNVFMNFTLDSFGSSLFISQLELPNVAVEAGDRMGWALAGGDFNGDGYDDLAIGSPGEDIGSLQAAGLVNVVYGTSSGLTFTGAQVWTQDSTGIADVAEAGDQFGYSLSSWNFGNGSRRDLAIGAPFEDLVSTVTGTLMTDAGAVHVLYGAASGLSSTSSQFWTQDSSGILDTAQSGDRFGNTLY